jgi:predicted DNA-binding transcriptional regulator AlpA
MTDGPVSTLSIGIGGKGAFRVSALPASLPPRGLSRMQAAEYIGVGGTKFDEMVADGRMPRPTRIDGRTVWDKWKLDAAFSALDDAAGAAASEWDTL